MKTLINVLACFLLASIVLLASAGVKVETSSYDFGTIKHLMIGGAVAHTWYE